MPDFSHLKKYSIQDKTAEFVFYEIEGQPTFTVAPAMETNPPYFNALLKFMNKTARAMKSGVITDDMIKDNRKADKSLYPKHIVKGWKNVVDAEGNPVPFTVENCEAFLEYLPFDQFEQLRQFAMARANFSDPFEVEEAAGN